MGRGKDLRPEIRPRRPPPPGGGRAITGNAGRRGGSAPHPHQPDRARATLGPAGDGRGPGQGSAGPARGVDAKNTRAAFSMSRDSVLQFGRDLGALVKQIREFGIDGSELEIDRLVDATDDLLGLDDQTKPEATPPQDAGERELHIKRQLELRRMRVRDPHNQELIELASWIADSLLKLPSGMNGMQQRDRSLDQLETISAALLGTRPIDFSFLRPRELWRDAGWISEKAPFISSERLRKAHERGKIEAEKRGNKNYYFLPDVIRECGDSSGELTRLLLGNA